MATVLLSVISIVSAAWGQGIQQVTINYIEALAAPDQFGNRVRAYVTVSSVDQTTVSGMSLSNFEALEDGREIKIQDVSQAAEPMAIILAIDTSGSMQARDRSGRTSMDAAKGAAVEFISMLGQDDQVALFSFNNESYLHLDFSTDHEAATDSVKALRAKHLASTRLYDTALEAVKKASEIPSGRRAVILLTDGKDEKGKGPCSIHSSNDVIDAATTRTIRTPIYTIGVGPQVDAKELGRMASLTGGRSMLASSLDELSDFYRLLANQLKKQYMVEYITRTPSGEHSLVIKVRHDASVEQDEKRFWSPPLPVIHPPTVSIVRPGPTDQIRGIVSVQADITPEKGLSKTRYYVDAALKEEKTSPPFGEFNWDTKGLPGGLHVLRVEAVHINGQIGSAETTVKMDAPPPPAPVAAETKESDKGISPVVYTGIVLLLVAIAIVAFCLLRQRKGEVSSGVQTMAREATPGAQAGRTKVRPVTPHLAADEKTTMDIQETLEPLAKLTVLKSNKLDLGATFKVPGTTEIGRGTKNKIRIPDKPVSREHAVIYCPKDQFLIRDLTSSFGTRVDGKDVTSTGSSLYDGAKIEFGTKTVMEFNTLIFGKEKEGSTDDKTLIYKP